MSDIELIALVLKKHGMEQVARDLIRAAKLRDDLEEREHWADVNDFMEQEYRYGRD